MFIYQQLTGERLHSRQPVRHLDFATCVAVDAGCMAVSGLAGGVAFGFAWVVLKIAGAI